MVFILLCKPTDRSPTGQTLTVGFGFILLILEIVTVLGLVPCYAFGRIIALKNPFQTSNYFNVEIVKNVWTDLKCEGVISISLRLSTTDITSNKP